MKFSISGQQAALAALLLAFLISPGALLGQDSSGAIHGQISDPSGAAVPSARVAAVSPTGVTKAGTVHSDGSYDITGLTPGTYTVRARAKGFEIFEQPTVQVAAGKTSKLNIPLKIVEEVEKVQVTEQSTQVSVNPTENASAIVIKGEDLNALSDDPDELQSELEALAGPSAGPNGGQIYVDGFTAGQLPPKADILEIRINQNPFSAEYDKVGYGRIEITTRPGSSKFHGQLMGDLNASPFNTRNPFAVQEPGYHTEYYNANVGGPINKKASFFFSFFRRDIGDESVVNTFDLDPTTLEEVPISQAVASPRTLTNLSPRIDLQLSTNNVLSVRYQFYDNNFHNSGVGSSGGTTSLASQGIDTHSDEHTVQVSDTDVISAKKLNQFRFQYLHDDATTVPQTIAPTLTVQGAFTGGGNSTGTSTDVQDHYEVQNLTSFFIGKHTLVVGTRLRDIQDASTSIANFNGTFTFACLVVTSTCTPPAPQTSYQVAEQNLQACANSGGSNCETSGAAQFLITAGTPTSNINMFDVGLFAQDDWKARPNLTLSAGLRWESQTGIADHSDFAPRLGLAWGLNPHKNGGAKTVLRAGFGIFYDRFPENLLLQAERLNGTTQQEYIVPDPTFFPVIPSISSLAGFQETPTRYQIDPHFRAPQIIESAASIEQQVTRNAKIAVTYLNSHGVHQLLTNDINAPLPGTFTLGDPQTGTRPYGNSVGNIYDFQSTGLFNQNQIIVNANTQINSKFSLTGYYTLGFANANTNGNNGGLIMNPYDIAENYGRAPFDVRHRVFLIGNWNLPHRFSLSPFLVAATGTPFNVTVSQDLFGTGTFNARPALAPAGATCGGSIVCTSIGNFSTLPPNAQAIIPPYGYQNPGQITFNLRLSKTISFGKEVGTRSVGGGGYGGGHGGHGGGRGPGGGLGPGGLNGGGQGGMFGRGNTTTNRRFTMTFSANARNLFNDVNLGPRTGTLGSPLFDQSNSLGGLFGSSAAQASNRRIDFQVVFTF